MTASRRRNRKNDYSPVLVYTKTTAGAVKTSADTSIHHEHAAPQPPPQADGEGATAILLSTSRDRSCMRAPLWSRIHMRNLNLAGRGYRSRRLATTLACGRTLPPFPMVVVIGFFSFPDLCGWEFFATFKTGNPGNLRSSIIGRASLDFLFFARVAPNARRFRDGGVCLAGQAILGLGIDAFPARLTAETSQIAAGWVGGGGEVFTRR